MTTGRFDQISKLLAERRLTRRQAVATGAASVAAGLAATGLTSAQDGTPESSSTPEVFQAEPFDPAQKIMYLFVQSYQSGSIVPTDGVEGRFTVTLEQGMGQTIYFADRPSRDVGALPTPDFLEGLGFSEENPPNAAMIVETADGTTDIAVVELFNPTHDPLNAGVTYEVEVLQNWQNDLELGFREEPAALADLAALAADFGSAHLLIDDCPSDGQVHCSVEGALAHTWTNIDTCWNYFSCIPCQPYGHTLPSRCATPTWWTEQCNLYVRKCLGKCRAGFSWSGSNSACV